MDRFCMAHSLRISLAVVHLAERIECKGEGLPLKNSMHFKETNGVSRDVNDNTEEKDVEENEITLQLKQTNISTTDEPLNNGRVDVTKTNDDDETPSPRRQMYGRSLSCTDSSYEGDAVLHSILKHSRSDGEYYCDDEEDDELSCSANSFTDVFFEDSVSNDADAPPEFGRRRIKSVTFNDEPTIFEFAKLTKKQIKKQMKEERARLAAQQKGIQNNKFSTSSGSDGSESEQKGKSRKKVKCEKKNRSYSDGLLQVPNSILSRHKIPKKKRNRKNSSQSSEGEDENISNCIPEPVNPEKTPVLNNPLIFELE